MRNLGRDKTIVACDFPHANAFNNFLDEFGDTKPYLKIGMELFYREGPEFVEKLIKKGHKVFLDLKLFDIPNTVARAVANLARLKPDIINVHALGGPDMIAKAREAIEAISPETKLIAVTILTSIDDKQFQRIFGNEFSLHNKVMELAQMSKLAGADGVVCSPLEAAEVKEQCGSDFLTVTPGIRPAGSDSNDQKRVLAPKEAIEGGSDLIVVGRPITKANNPFGVYQAIVQDINS